MRFKDFLEKEQTFGTFHGSTGRDARKESDGIRSNLRERCENIIIQVYIVYCRVRLELLTINSDAYVVIAHIMSNIH
jgi:hypothetical protein